LLLILHNYITVHGTKNTKSVRCIVIFTAMSTHTLLMYKAHKTHTTAKCLCHPAITGLCVCVCVCACVRVCVRACMLMPCTVILCLSERVSLSLLSILSSCYNVLHTGDKITWIQIHVGNSNVYIFSTFLFSKRNNFPFTLPHFILTFQDTDHAGCTMWILTYWCSYKIPAEQTNSSCEHCHTPQSHEMHDNNQNNLALAFNFSFN
jgi:hypothetical protein